MLALRPAGEDDLSMSMSISVSVSMSSSSLYNRLIIYKFEVTESVPHLTEYRVLG